MKTTTINLYTVDELSKKAFEKAYQKWKETCADDPMLPAHLGNLLKEELEARKIKYDTDSIRVMYSLGYSQGDGLMFEGTLYPSYGKGHSYIALIKHSGHYYHENSRVIDWREEDGSDGDIDGRDYKQFETEYAEICKKIAQAGYNEIEHAESEEVFREMCEGNDWTFEENGTMRNA